MAIVCSLCRGLPLNFVSMGVSLQVVSRNPSLSRDATIYPDLLL